VEGVVSLTTDCSKIFHETGDHNANVKHTGPQSQFIHLQTLGFSSPSLLYLCAPQRTALEMNQPTSARFAQPSVTKRSPNRTALSSLLPPLFPLPSSLFPLPSSLFPLPSSLFPLPSSLFPLPSSLPHPFTSSLPHPFTPSPLHPFPFPPPSLPIPISLHADKNGNLTFLESRSVLSFYFISFCFYLFIFYFIFYIAWFGLVWFGEKEVGGDEWVGGKI